MNEEKIVEKSKNPKKSLNTKVAIIVSSIVIVMMVSIAGIVGFQYLTKNNNIAESSTVANDGNSASVSDESASIVDVANKLSPSVVSIVTKSQSSYGRYNISSETEGAGTGIIVSSGGYILTNKHVIDGASTVSVVLYKGTTY